MEVEVLYGPGKGNRHPNGKGVAGDCESEGSRRQSAGLTNRKRIEAAQRGETAHIVKARYLHGTLRRRSDRHKREGECAIPGEICGPAREGYWRREALRMGPQKSAEAIVGAPRTEGPNMMERE